MAKKRESKKQTNSLVFPLLFTPLETRRGGEVKKKVWLFFLNFRPWNQWVHLNSRWTFGISHHVRRFSCVFSFSSFLLSHLMRMNEAVWLLLSAEETNENDNTVVSQVWQCLRRVSSQVVPYSTQEREKMREARVKQYISQQSVSASSSNSLRKSPVRCHPTCQPSTVKSSRTTKKRRKKEKRHKKSHKINIIT